MTPHPSIIIHRSLPPTGCPPSPGLHVGSSTDKLVVVCFSFILTLSYQRKQLHNTHNKTQIRCHWFRTRSQLPTTSNVSENALNSCHRSPAVMGLMLRRIILLCATYAHLSPARHQCSKPSFTGGEQLMFDFVGSVNASESAAKLRCESLLWPSSGGREL